MLDCYSIRSNLYSRQQVARLTGLDDSTLNYWMREGVLRAAEGGTGKGQHRRFPYHQINLALLLDQLRGFGVSLPALKRLATRFHDAMLCYDRLGVSRENYDDVDSILYLRRQMEKNGFIEHSVTEDDLARYIEIFPWFTDRKLYRTHRHLAFKFEVSFEEAIDLYRRGHLVYDRPVDRTERFSDRIVELARTLDLAALDEARPYWSAITAIETKALEEVDLSYYTAEIVYRDEAGEWRITSGDPSAPMLSYVGVYLEVLVNQAWSKLQAGEVH